MSMKPGMSALDAIYQRRATRAYTQERVSRPLVMKLRDAAVHAPTAMHVEPWAFAVVQDRALLARICVGYPAAPPAPSPRRAPTMLAWKE